MIHHKPLGLLAAPFLLALAFAPAAHAQFIAYESRLAGLPLFDSFSSARLTAMGGLELVVPDENRELNLFDFGRNLAGLAEDKDGWSIEAQYARRTDALDYNSMLGGAPIRQRQVINQNAALTQIVSRQGGKALGATVQFDSQDQDYRFGADNLMRGPRIAGYYNQSFGGLRCAVGATRWTDNEDIASPDVFSIRHTSDVWLVNLAAAIHVAGIDLGGQADLENVTISGKSRDAAGFHQDEFEWRRPATKLRATAVLARPGRLQAGVNLAVGSRNGTEEVKVSWSDRFPANPGRFSYANRTPTFHEKEREVRFEGRASYRLSGPLRLSGYGSFDRFKSDVTEAGNWIGSRRAQDAKDKLARLGGGIGTSLAQGKLIVGVEVFGLFRTNDLVVPRSDTSIKSRDLELTVGGEWLVRPAVALRAGYTRQTVDEDVDQPETLNAGNGISFGFGYLPRGGLVSLDAGVRGISLDPDGETGSNRRRSSTEYVVGTRFLF